MLSRVMHNLIEENRSKGERKIKLLPGERKSISLEILQATGKGVKVFIPLSRKDGVLKLIAQGDSVLYIEFLTGPFLVKRILNGAGEVLYTLPDGFKPAKRGETPANRMERLRNRIERAETLEEFAEIMGGKGKVLGVLRCEARRITGVNREGK